jgi:phosphatidate cytidylyltransferase
MLGKRIVTSAVLIGVIIVSLFAGWLFGLLATFLIILGLYEFFAMLGNKGIVSYKYFGIAMGSIIPLSLIFRFELTKSWELLFIVLGLLFLILMQFRRRESSGVVTDISTTIFGILYVSWFFSFLIKIRYLPDGAGLVAAVLLITKAGDVGAYLVGSRFGKRIGRLCQQRFSKFFLCAYRILRNIFRNNRPARGSVRIINKAGLPGKRFRGDFSRFGWDIGFDR